MKKRNGFTVMAKLIGLVRPLAGAAGEMVWA